MAPQSPLTRRIATFALGVGAGVAACAAVSSGVLGSTPGLRPPAAAAAELPAFDDCEQLRQWYVDQALPDVGPWGLSGPPVMYAMDKGTSAERAAGPTPSSDGVGSSETGTNVQEPDVDESDVAKTDGHVVVQVIGNRLVVTDVTGAAPRQLSDTRLPGPQLLQPELLLHGDHVVVVGNEAGRRYGGPISWGRTDTPEGKMAPGFAPAPPQDLRTRVLGVDIADPASPEVTSDRSIDGSSVSTREYPDGTVRAVVTTRHPTLDFVQPNRDRSDTEATRLNRRIVEQAPIDAWLPGVRDDGGSEHPLLDCSEVRHPLHGSGPGTISVLTFPADDPADATATGVTASGDLVYSSARRLYVATTADRSTTVHAFALDGDRTTYVASGSVGGTVKDRWSFSEYDGHLRVAAAIGDSWRPDQNAVVVLDEQEGRLVRVGRVDGLGRDEQIRSVRWLGDLAVVVTFRQTDPLYTLDLSNAEAPRLVGTLKIPGFSSYLHPVGDDRVVGIGHDASVDGLDLGTQASTFDVRDPRHVRRDDTLSLGSQSDVPVGTDSRSFSYLPSQHVLLTPVSDWRSGGTRVVAIRVDADGSLARVGSWATEGWSGDVRTLPLSGDRVAVVGTGVRVVDVP